MEISVPDLGDFADVEIIDIFVKVGDRIEPEDPLVSLETDKATMDVPSPAGGSVVAVNVAVGDRVSKGDVLVVLDGEQQNAQPGAGNGGGKAKAAANQASSAAGGDAASASASGGRSSAAARAGTEEQGATASAPSGQSAAEGAHAGGSSSAAQASATRVPPRSVVVPDLGDFHGVEIIEVLVAEGDEVEAEQGLVTLETEKATMDVPAPEPGKVLSLAVKAGDRVSSGDEILKLEPRLASPPDEDAAPARASSSGAPQAQDASAAAARSAASTAGSAAPAESAASAESAPPAARPAAPVQLPIDEASFSRAHASPSVRKLARELGVDLGRVRGSGGKGRVTADDVKSFVKEILRGGGAAARGGLPAVPEVDFSKFGEIELQPLSRIQRISGARLHASWVNLPHITQHDEADITALEETRQSLKAAAEERGIRLTPLAFILRACVIALDEFPHFKSSLSTDGESLVMKRYTHLGFAADTPKGLVVPVIRDADKKDIYELAAELGTLSERARSGKLKPDDMQGGVFTVSSLGGIGGTFFTPIINAPEVAILGVSRSQWRPVYRDKEFVPRLMLPLSLSYDHRVIDGAAGARFTTRLAAILGDVERLIEAIP